MFSLPRQWRAQQLHVNGNIQNRTGRHGQRQMALLSASQFHSVFQVMLQDVYQVLVDVLGGFSPQVLEQCQRGRIKKLYRRSRRALWTRLRRSLLLHQLQQPTNGAVQVLHLASGRSCQKRSDSVAEPAQYNLARVTDFASETRGKVFEYLESSGVHVADKALLKAISRQSNLSRRVLGDSFPVRWLEQVIADLFGGENMRVSIARGPEYVLYQDQWLSQSFRYQLSENNW